MNDFVKKIVITTNPEGGMAKVPFYYNSNNDYITNCEIVANLLSELLITPELAQAKDKACSIGFSKSRNKWLGWWSDALHYKWFDARKDAANFTNSENGFYRKFA